MMMVNTVKVGVVPPIDGNDRENLKPKGSRDRGRQLCILDLLKTLDVDGDGDIDEDDKKIGEALKKMDMDGDGMITIRELVNIGKIKVGDEAKIANLRKYMILGGAISLLFIGLSLCTVILAIELTKESRNKDSVMMDAVSGKPVATAPFTGGIDVSTGKKDTAVRDSEGNVAASGIAKGSTVLSSRTMTVETAKAITELMLPVRENGKPLMVSMSVTGFELAPDGSKCVFHTASGGMVMVVDEDITVYKMSVTGEIRTLPVDPARPATRRHAARRLAKLRRRSLLQDSNSTFLSDSSVRTTTDGFGTACPSGAACGSGACTGSSLCSPPVCMSGQEYNPATEECECPPGSSLEIDAYGYSSCKCEEGSIMFWHMDENYQSLRLCLPCAGGARSTSDGYSCYDCPPANGVDRIWMYGTPDYVSMGTATSAGTSSGPPSEAGFCKGCPPGQHREVKDWGNGYVYEFCICDNPCMVLEWDMVTQTNVCRTCSAGTNAIHSDSGYRWCSSSVNPDWGESWCFDNNSGNGAVDSTRCVAPMTFDTSSGTCTPPTVATCVAPMYWDSLSAACVASPNTATCAAPMAYDPVAQACISPTVTCDAPQVYDPITRACATLVTCYSPMVYDATTSACATPVVVCSPPMVVDWITGSCVTPATKCTPPQTYNPETLSCFTPTTTVTCEAPRVYNSATMECVTASIICTAPSVFDAASNTCKTCVPPMAYDDDAKTCVAANPQTTCSAPMVYDDVTHKCIAQCTGSTMCC